MKTQFKKYQNNELSEAQRDALESKMMTELFEHQAKKDWEKRLSEAGVQRSQPTLSGSKSSNSSWQWVMVAASVALLALVGSQFLFSPPPPVSGGKNNILALYVDARDVSLGTRMGESTLDYWALGSQAFNNGNYAGAESAFLKIAKPNNEQLYYLGIAQFYQQKFETARANFEKVVNTNGQLATESTWHLALSQLKTNQVNAGKANLNRLVAAQDYKATEAKQLLESLK